ncbi:hypothetical protein [Pseudopelagicola sp. nBUS_19]|uniref:hypothetical protein n=1 Tax=Pseudopelagicola sp. nBUS_19 TaxID=3395316 RepID=UPI003EBF0231
MMKRVILLFLISAVIFSANQMVGQPQASQMKRPVLFLRCDDVQKNYCQAMLQVLSKEAPTHSIRVVSGPLVPGVTLITLTVDQRKHNRLLGTLSWDTGKGIVEYGPAHSCVSVSTATELVSYSSAYKCAEGLINRTPELRAALVRRQIE